MATDLPARSVVVVVGNPKPMSRTCLVAEAVGGAVADALSLPVTPTIDLADHGPNLFDWGNELVAALNATVAASTVCIFASPTYKATYTGLLKVFLDRYGNDGLRGVVGVPLMVGAAPIHAMAPEVFLRPLLVELGASVPARGLYVLESQLDALADVISAWADAALPLIRAVAERQ